MPAETSRSPEAAWRVQIVAADSASHNRLCDMLRESCEIVSQDPEVVVVQRASAAEITKPEAQELSRRPAVIAIGNCGAETADVVLPTDFLPRELQVSCRLLSEVVRLRRRLEEHTQQEQAWQQEAFCDSLTKLPNRRAWDEELVRRMQTARSTASPLCVALADLDHFKQVNDGWGHPAGDQLLAALGPALRQSLRAEDFVARLGGDEFGLLLSGLDAFHAAAVLERIRAALPARIAQTTRFVTSATVGFYIYEGQCSETAEEVLARADLARRRAKTAGRDRSVGF